MGLDQKTKRDEFMGKDIYSMLLSLRKYPILDKVSYYTLKVLGVELPLSVELKGKLTLEHGAVGTVVHSKTSIGNNVKIYSNVTIGRADVYIPAEVSKFEKVIIEDDVILGSGCKVLCKEGVLQVAKGTVVGANAVLLQSTGENEIWAGIPARRIGFRNL
jgi:serine O-acetyltransferase